MRYTYSRHGSQQSAEAALEDAFASCEVSSGESPKIERATGTNGKPLWVITLSDGYSASLSEATKP